ncbi:MAG: 4-hydroxybenzoate octaprenyltransferase [Alphaproteobacteria bacterium]
MNQTRTLHGDIPRDGWVDRALPGPVRPYARLMRLDRPIGTWLLLLPCWWSIALAAGPDLAGQAGLVALFGVGAVVMRGAGCTYNDIVDRDFDARVARTAARPIPSGAVTARQATVFLGGLLLVGLLVLLPLDSFAIAVGVASLPLVFTYPFMKRITYWPQAWLGLTFNWGALMGWAAVRGEIAAPAVTLYVAGLFWTLGYDTIYAHQDREDDALIGVRSTALALGRRTRPAMALFYALALGLTAVAGVQAGLGGVFLALLLPAAAQLAWQVVAADIDDPANCLAIFRSNRLYGWLVLAAIVAGGFA